MGHWILRNNTTREDAVYKIMCVRNYDGSYTVTGEWGRWETYMNGGKLQFKTYYSGKSLITAESAAKALRSSKLQKGYCREPSCDTAMPWEATVTPAQVQQIAATAPTFAPFTPKPKTPPPADPRKQTVAGLLELE